MSREQVRSTITDLMHTALTDPSPESRREAIVHAYFQGLGAGEVDSSGFLGNGISAEEFVRKIQEMREVDQYVERFESEDLHQKNLTYSDTYRALVGALVKI